MQNLSSLKAQLQNPKRVMITTHHKPDADALGSSLGLAHFLRKLGHQVTVITPTDYPEFLHWMPGNSEVMVFNNGNEARAADVVNDADIIFCLDFSALHRINELGDMVRVAKAYKVLIDHHQDPEDFADFMLHSTQAAATAQLIYVLIEAMGQQEHVDKQIAECLYAGIMTDTGSFKHPNTTQEVHEIVAKLIGCGADTAKVSKLIYDNNSVNRLKFIGYALSEKLVMLENLKTAYFTISSEELKRFHCKTGDTEGLVNYALSIKGIVLAAVIIDREDGVKMSFRSVGDFPVNKFANAHFNGGGHKNAAGGRSELSLALTEKKFMELLPQYRDQLNQTIAAVAHAYAAG